MPNIAEVNGISINADSFFQYGSGTLITLAQDVEVYYTTSTSETLIIITQTVKATVDTSTSLITIAQKVRNQAIPSYYDRNGWDAFIYIDGYQIPQDQITGDISITKTENEANQMNFTIIPNRGVQDLTDYEGKPVKIIVHTSRGLIQTFTGTVDIPTIDLNERKIRISCTNNRKQLINSNPPIMSNIGIYDEGVFGEAVDYVDELDKRLSTSPYSISFDGYNNIVLSNYFASATPNLVFTEDDVYQDNGKDVQVSLTARSKIVNRVEINYSYRRNRLWHQDTLWTWAVDWTGVCDFLVNGYSIPLRAAITAAQQSSGWVLNAPIDFTDFYQSGYYTCDGLIVGFSTSTQTYATAPVTTQTTDAAGNPVTTNTVDSSGKQVFQQVVTGSTDYSKLFCKGATWVASYQWVQNLTEVYTLSVTSPQSINQFEEVLQTDTASLESTYNTEEWTNYKEYNGVMGGYIDETQDLPSAVKGISCLLNKARYTILKSHRDNKVAFNTFIRPDVELYHTVAVDAISYQGSEITAKGKVRQVTHTLNTGTGDCNTRIEIALSLSDGSDFDSPLIIPSRPASVPTATQTDVVPLGNHWGVLPTPEMNGMIGNKAIVELTGGTHQNFTHTTYPVSFVVDTPEIPEDLTANVEYSQTGSYAVNLIDDDLTIVF